MAKNGSSPKSNEPELKGTIVSIIILGVVLIAFWVGVWMLFLSRS